VKFMDSWFTYLKQGLPRKLPKDRIASQEGGYEACLNQSGAFRREKYLKTTDGGRYLKK